MPRFGLGVAAMFALASPVQAFQRVEFSQNVEVEKVETGAEGQRKISFAAPETVVPGDRLRFTLQLDNHTSEAAAGLKFVNPIPPEVRFASTDDLAGFSVSVDGGRTYGDLAGMTVPVVERRAASRDRRRCDARAMGARRTPRTGCRQKGHLLWHRPLSCGNDDLLR
ncbi:hypothetical protein [Sphingopyxis sp. PET50]|uniref:hypothetical protein n=1 Tax=Sphingopyxis sp. PET50 TaxID=2976533 RepID=UPI0021AEF451|nr:hypothetical protein [Sphingopyxis sp. PET50]